MPRPTLTTPISASDQSPGKSTVPDERQFGTGRILLLVVLLVLPISPAASAPESSPCGREPALKIASLEQLAITALRNRQYASSPRILERRKPVSPQPLDPGSRLPGSYMATYFSDQLRVYTRLDIPVTAMPSNGYPVVLFTHGWVGRQGAPGYEFGSDREPMYTALINQFVQAGFVVLAPGYRGHGTVAGTPAEGIEWLDAWDNGSYLMPSFYAMDVLNLLAGLDKINRADWAAWGYATGGYPRLDLSAVNLLGHSQGGDVALTVLAAAGEGSKLQQQIRAASIWSGNIPDRFTQANTFGPMASTLQAFMSGDGTWTGSAEGDDGSINPNFIFPWPSDSIATVQIDTPQWTWQANRWSTPTVEQALRKKYGEMYNTLNACVGDIAGQEFSIGVSDSGKVSVEHPPAIVNDMLNIGGYGAAQWLTEPLVLHSSDRDYYSLPAWNANLVQAINASGGNARHFTYSGNNHSLRISKHRWFSPAGSHEGFPTAVARDIDLFSSPPSAARNYRQP